MASVDIGSTEWHMWRGRSRIRPSPIPRRCGWRFSPGAEQLAHAVGALDAFRLAGLSPLVTVGGSLIAGLAVLEKAMTPEQAWDAVSIDERWQLEQWGADPEAELALENRKRDFLSAARFLGLLDA